MDANLLLDTAVVMSLIVFILSIYRLISKVQKKKALLKLYTIQNEFVENNLISYKLANKAIFRLVNFAQRVKPDCIVGLNRGGTMVGAYLSLGLDVPSRNFAKFLIDEKTNIFDCSTESLHGVVLVVDDICRTGNTMGKSINKILESKSKITAVYSATLFAALDEYKMPKYDELSFCSYVTYNDDLSLPWTIAKPGNYGDKEIRNLFSEIKDTDIEEFADEVSINLHPGAKKFAMRRNKDYANAKVLAPIT